MNHPAPQPAEHKQTHWLRQKVYASRFALYALMLVGIIHLPAMKEGGVNAGILYTGDVLGYYLPAILKAHSLIASHNFGGAIDYSQFNGSSDFFLSPNFFALHPLVILRAFLVPIQTNTLHGTGVFLMAMMAFHSFLACYFSLKLFTRFFQFSFWPAALVGTYFTFSPYMADAMAQPPFLFCASIVPWAVYTVLHFVEQPSWRSLITATLPIMMGMLGGYLPLGVACLFLSGVLVISKLFVIDRQISPLQTMGRLALPYLSAFIVLSPFLYASLSFHMATSSGNLANLFYSAHQLAELPTGILRALSTHISIPGMDLRFGLGMMWGMVPITIAAVFVLGRRAPSALTQNEWRLFLVAATIYFATVLATFGQSSPISDMVYYFVPQVGKMHIYQRFLLPAHLLFGVMIALMLKAILEVRPPIATRIVIFVLVIATVATAIVHVTFENGFTNNALVFELFVACLFAISLLVPFSRYVFFTASILAILPVVNQIYDYSLGDNQLAVQYRRQPMVLDGNERVQFAAYLAQFNDKPIIKYADLTPLWTSDIRETVPKDYPYFVLPSIHLSSYGGFTFYLSSLADYMKKMPVLGEDVAVVPDWAYLQATGADLIIATDKQIEADEYLSMLKHRIAPELLYRLPNDALVIPLRQPGKSRTDDASVLFDNGYFRIFDEAAAKHSENLALHARAVQSSTYGNALAGLAVDGNTNGDFQAGSVTHTKPDANAWLDIDLGKSQRIDAIRIWNRSDCCSQRLSSFKIFLSNKPFTPRETAATVKIRPQTSTYVGQVGITPVDGQVARYVRLQFDRHDATMENALSIAEVEVLRYTPPTTKAGDLVVKDFKTNFGSAMRLRLTSSSALTLQYLFWRNPNLAFYVDGKTIAPRGENGLSFLDIPPGEHVIEVRYRYWPMRIFAALYVLFGLAWLWAKVPRSVTNPIARRFNKLRSNT